MFLCVLKSVGPSLRHIKRRRKVQQYLSLVRDEWICPPPAQATLRNEVFYHWLAGWLVNSSTHFVADRDDIHKDLDVVFVHALLLRCFGLLVLLLLRQPLDKSHWIPTCAHHFSGEVS